MNKRLGSDRLERANPAEIRFRIWLLLGLSVGCAAALPFDVTVARVFLIEQVKALSGDLYRSITMLEIFGHGIGSILFVTGLLVIRPDLWRVAVRFVISLLICGGLVTLIKMTVIRYRPRNFFLADGTPMLQDDSQSWVGVIPWTSPMEGSFWNQNELLQSFPSGHAATAMAFAVWLSWLCPRGRFLFVLLALVACLQRILAHAHWPSDVFAGAAVGVLAAWISAAVPLPEKSTV